MTGPFGAPGGNDHETASGLAGAGPVGAAAFAPVEPAPDSADVPPDTADVTAGGDGDEPALDELALRTLAEVARLESEAVLSDGERALVHVVDQLAQHIAVLVGHARKHEARLSFAEGQIATTTATLERATGVTVPRVAPPPDLYPPDYVPPPPA